MTYLCVTFTESEVQKARRAINKSAFDFDSFSDDTFFFAEENPDALEVELDKLFTAAGLKDYYFFLED
jgi:hypothetical protein